MKINIKSISVLRNMLLQKADQLKLNYTPDLVVIDAEENFVHININSWSTFKGSIRLSDLRYIPEGVDLTSKGLTLNQVYSRVCKNLIAHAKHIKLFEQAEKTNSLLFNGYLVKCIGFKPGQFFKNPNTIFEIQSSIVSSRWHGFNARDALNNASPFIKSKIKSIKLIGESLK